VRVFSYGQIEEALEHAREGGQALHLFDPRPHCKASTPACFRRASEAGHLFDRDRDRLVRTARQLGVRKILVDRDGRRGQHVDLVGAPLRKAKQLAEETSKPKQGSLFG